MNIYTPPHVKILIQEMQDVICTSPIGGATGEQFDWDND